jgi:hypothetical protein
VKVSRVLATRGVGYGLVAVVVCALASCALVRSASASGPGNASGPASGLATTPVLPPSGYWDFQGNLAKGQAYSEANIFNPDPPHLWGIRLSRTGCGTKIRLWTWGHNSSTIVSIPGGCATNDYSYYYDSSTYEFAECYNEDGPTMWVNCRVAGTL